MQKSGVVQRESRARFERRGRSRKEVFGSKGQKWTSAREKKKLAGIKGMSGKGGAGAWNSGGEGGRAFARKAKLVTGGVFIHSNERKKTPPPHRHGAK